MKPVPPLTDCPGCGLPVQAGESPFNLAWHDCDWVSALRAEAMQSSEPLPETLEAAERELIAAVMRKIRDPRTTPRDASSLIDSVANLQKAKGGGRGGQGGGAGEGSALGDWVSRR